MKINNWAKRIQDRIKWKEVVERPKLSNHEVVAPNEEKERRLHLHDILKEKKSWVKCVYYVTEHTICNFVSTLSALSTLHVFILSYRQYRQRGKNVQVNVKLSLSHTTKADRGITGPLILKIDARWRCVVNFRLRPLDPQKKTLVHIE